MDAADIGTINEWFTTHSRDSYKITENQAAEESDETDDEDLEAAVDMPRIHREILTCILTYLGDDANTWQYVLQFNDHIGVLHPEKSAAEANELLEKLEGETKAQLGLEGYPVLESLDAAEFNEAVKDLAARHPGDERLRATGSGQLPDVLEQVDRICDCWLPDYVVRALHRSGAFLKQEATRRSVDLGLWRWNLPSVRGGGSG